MNYYTITLTLTVHANTEQEAKDQFDLALQYGQYDHDSIEVERDYELEQAIDILQEY